MALNALAVSLSWSAAEKFFPLILIEIFKLFSSLIGGGSGFLILLETSLDDSGNLTVDEELTVDAVPIVLSDLLSEVDIVLSEVLEATGLFDEFIELTVLVVLDELTELAELDIKTEELSALAGDEISEDELSEVTGSFVDVC